MRWRTWRAAMQDALYGEGGFYARSGAPGRHFRTAAHVGPAWAAAVLELTRRVDVALGEPEHFTFVDVGAGGGELLTALAAEAPERWRVVGVDVAPRPSGLPARVEWAAEAPSEVTGVELLDVVPLDVVERTEDGLRIVEVGDDGAERLGNAPDEGVREWLERWWSPVDVGDRAEVGLSRDAVWADLVDRLDAGLAVGIDYPADPERDVAGTLTGYRDGRQVLPVPDGSCDLTAHVLLESCAAAVAGAQTLLVSQREALQWLGMSGRRPAYGGDATAYLQELGAAGDAAELLDPHGLGGFGWLVHARGMALPLGVSWASPPARR